MSDVILSILCVGLILVIVGHGIWVFVAWVFRALTGSTAAPSIRGTRCSVCQNPHSVFGGRCEACGAPANVSDEMRRRADEFATRRQLAVWAGQGKLSPETHQSLLRLLDASPVTGNLNEGLAAPDSPFVTTASSPAKTEVPAPLGSLAPDSGVPRPTPPVAVIPPPVAEVEIVAAQVVEEHPLDRIAEPVPPAPRPSAPRRAFADMLQAFMEQKNIRWIELISGLLIVGCATGLVISLRQALRDKIPYFPALSFMLVTAAFHAAGIYSLRRWNLKSTSRGVLIIATLLVPLSILAAIFLSGEGEQQRTVTDPVFLIAVLIGVLSFGTMNYFASQALVRHGWWRIMLAVLGASLGQLIINRGHPDSLGPIGASLLMLPAVGAYVAANLASLFHVRRRHQVGRRPTQQFFLELGIATFAVMAPIGLFIARSGSASAALRDLSPLLSLTAAALLASGLFVHQRIRDAKLAAFRTTGTAIGILGAGLMLLMLTFAWPDLQLLAAVGLLNFVTLTLLAVVGSLTLLHGVAVICFSLAFLSGFLQWRGLPATAGPGVSRQLLQTILTGVSATALTVFASVVAAVGIGLLRTKRNAGLAYLLASAAIGCVCIAIAFYVGYWVNSSDGNWATLLFLYFAVATLGGAWYTGNRESTWFGSFLLLAGTVHGLWLNDWLGAQLATAGLATARPVLAGSLIHSVLAAVLAGLSAWAIHHQNGVGSLFRKTTSIMDEAPAEKDARPLQESFSAPLMWSALITSLAAMPFALFVTQQRFSSHACYVLSAAVAWFIIALMQQARWAWNGFQILTTFALAYFSAFIASRQAWWSNDVWDARHVQLQQFVLAIGCIGWFGLRHLLTKYNRLPFVHAAKTVLTVDQGLLVLLVLGSNVTAVFGCIPGIWSELGLAPSTDESIGNALRFLSIGSWLALSAIVFAVGLAIWERRSLSTVFLLVIASMVVPLLLSGTFYDQRGTASALRWTFALYSAIWCLPACYFGGPKNRSTDWFADLPPLSRPSDVMRVASLIAVMLVVIGITTVVLLRVAAGDGIAGTTPESIFTRIGSASSYATPLAILVAVLFAYGIRESQPGYTFAASLVFQYFISLSCLLPALSAGANLDAIVWAEALQWNAVGLGAFAGIWTMTRRWIEPEQAALGWRLRDAGYLSADILLTLAAGFAMAAWIAVSVWTDPIGVLGPMRVLGTWPSYLAVILSGASIWWLTRREPGIFRGHAIHFLLMVLVPIIAATAHRFDLSSQSWAYHALVLGWLAVAGIATGWFCWRMRAIAITAHPPYSQDLITGVGWSTVAAILSAFSALTNIDNVPSRVCETFAACGGIVVTGILAIRSRLQPFAYASILCGGIASLLFYSDLPTGHPLRTELGLMTQFSFSVLAIACVWLACEIWFQRRGELGLGRRGFGAAHRFVARLSLAATLLFLALTSLHLVIGREHVTLKPSELLTFILMFLALFALQLGSLWDRRGHYGTLGLYLWLLAVNMFIVEQLPLTRSARIVAWIVTMAIQVAMTGWVWSWGGKLAVIGKRFGMVDPIESLRRTSRWLILANLILAAEVVLASTWVVLAVEARELRVTAACLPILIAAGVAGIAQQHRRDAMQLLSLLTASWGAVLLGWADIPPDSSNAAVLARAIRLLMALSAMAFVLGVIAVRVIPAASSWLHSSRRGAVVLATGAIAALCSVLALEAITFEPGIGAPVNAMQIAAVSVMLVGLIATLISLAVLPGRDPFALTERGRMAYVYGAQVVAALLFAHIYLAIPELFHGTLRKYWPYIIVVIAFAGVGVGTLFDRLGWRVLAEPFRNSGSFLPLIPAIGMWVVNSGSSYTMVLFVIGVLYMLLSFSQKSLWAGAAAAVAGNGSLWSLLSGEENLTFGQHPQFWLIPPAISVMVAAQLNRKQLSDAQLSAIRYVGMLVMYLSSFFEIVKIGIGESLWPPVILICLSLAGVAFGIAMQVRAFLYMGSGFVLVSVITMVAHAARSIDHVWPWWAFGIGMGISILVIFGYFEGRRTQIMALIERLRQWEK